MKKNPEGEKTQIKAADVSPKWYNNAAIVAAIVIGLFGIFGVILTFVLPRIFAPEPPKTYRATLSKLSVETNVPLAKYLDRSHIASDGYTADELRQNGYVVHF